MWWIFTYIWWMNAAYIHLVSTHHDSAGQMPAPCILSEDHQSQLHFHSLYFLVIVIPCINLYFFVLPCIHLYLCFLYFIWRSLIPVTFPPSPLAIRITDLFAYLQYLYQSTGSYAEVKESGNSLLYFLITPLCVKVNCNVSLQLTFTQFGVKINS